MTGWEVFSGRASVPAGMLAELAALRAALPGYDVLITSHGPACRYEAIRRDPGAGTWCVISSDPADLWRELAPRARPAPAGDRPDHAHSARLTIGSHLASRIPPLDSATGRPHRHVKPGPALFPSAQEGDPRMPRPQPINVPPRAAR